MTDNKSLKVKLENLEKANQKLIEWIVLSVLYHESDFSLHFMNTALYELKESGKKLIKHKSRLGNE